MRNPSRSKAKVKKVEAPPSDYVVPAPAKKPPPTLFLFHNQVGLARSFNDRLG